MRRNTCSIRKCSVAVSNQTFRDSLNKGLPSLVPLSHCELLISREHLGVLQGTFRKANGKGEGKYAPTHQYTVKRHGTQRCQTVDLTPNKDLHVGCKLQAIHH